MRAVNPTGIFLMETMIDCVSASRVLQKIGFYYFIYIPLLLEEVVLFFVGVLIFVLRCLSNLRIFFIWICF